ncbi:hypothetical protein ENFAE_25860 [Enterococcus faecalis]|nr:hypothetical protein ENFAE_25860 [Enterococcus faecalis]
MWLLFKYLIYLYLSFSFLNLKSPIYLERSLLNVALGIFFIIWVFIDLFFHSNDFYFIYKEFKSIERFV